MNIRFLTLEEVQEIHRSEIAAAVCVSGVRDIDRLKSAIGAAHATFDGKLPMSTFDLPYVKLYNILYLWM